MTSFYIEKVDNSNKGIAREWALCKHYGVERTAHDSVAYDKGSDLVAYGKNISVKASRFSLMSGSLCEGLEDFDSIWNLYESKVHSDTFAYVTEDFRVFEMDINEFKEFVKAFGRLDRESKKNGGKVKIKCLKESKKMVEWLSMRTA